MRETVLVVSHDDSYSHAADRILKLNYGRTEQDIQSPSAPPVSVTTS